MIMYCSCCKRHMPVTKVTTQHVRVEIFIVRHRCDHCGTPITDNKQ